MNIENKPSDNAMLALFEQQEAVFDAMVREFQHARCVEQRQSWKTISFRTLRRVWASASVEGFVRDEKALQRIEERFIENVLRLMVNTELAEHGTMSVQDVVDGRLSGDQIEAFVTWAIELPGGGWRISDGLEPLVLLAARVLEENDGVRKIALLDRMLNVVHQRSDLAGWFVEGGTRALSELSDDVRTFGTEQLATPKTGAG